MKVLLINGSPHAQGCTFTALSAVAETLNAAGVDTEMFQLGSVSIHTCTACGACKVTGRCVFKDDPVNACIEKLAEADGVVIGSPVYYAAPNGALLALLNRVFYMKSAKYAFKPGAAVVSCRRGGSSAALDALNKYFTISHMPIVSSQYWNMVHGMTPNEVARDEEGMQTMRQLGRNMAWMVKSLAAARASVPLPEMEKRIATNFIRTEQTSATEFKIRASIME